MQREIVLDTETTGLDPNSGDRLIEIGCVELINRMPTGNEFHVYINPDRDVPAEAQAVHGLSTEFLRDKDRFEQVADSFIEFIAGDTLVIHNAPFDIGFLNAELDRSGRPVLTMDRVVDTLKLARRKHPGASNNLDALCKRYGIDNSNRVKHGALLDSLLLADVYVELLGERQAKLELSRQSQSGGAVSTNMGSEKIPARTRQKPLANRLKSEDLELHSEFIGKLGAEAIWNRYQ